MKLQSIKEHPRRRSAANDDNQAVIARIEQISSTIPGLTRRLRPVLSAARDGAITRIPNEVFFYLLGALHALEVADDDFYKLQDVLNFLLPNQGVESWPSLT